MLDADECRLTSLGAVEVSAGRIVVRGFEAHRGSCRDVAALGVLWAIGELQRELMKLMERPGGGDIVVD